MACITFKPEFYFAGFLFATRLNASCVLNYCEVLSSIRLEEHYVALHLTINTVQMTLNLSKGFSAANNNVGTESVHADRRL